MPIPQSAIGSFGRLKFEHGYSTCNRCSARLDDKIASQCSVSPTHLLVDRLDIPGQHGDHRFFGAMGREAAAVLAGAREHPEAVADPCVRVQPGGADAGSHGDRYAAEPARPGTAPRQAADFADSGAGEGCLGRSECVSGCLEAHLAEIPGNRPSPLLIKQRPDRNGMVVPEARIRRRTTGC